LRPEVGVAQKLRLSPETVWAALKSSRPSGSGGGWIGVAGARELAGVLARELGRGAAPGAVRVTADPRGASVLVYVLAGPAGEEASRMLRAARRPRVPVIVVLADPALEARVPFVLATDIVRVGVGAAFPVDEIARRIAEKLDDEAAPLAALVPALRRPVCDALIASYSKRAAVIGAAVFLPGADMPALTLNQIRLVLMIATAHGVEVDRERLSEVLAVVASGFALRTAARQVLGAVPVAGWAVKGAIAFAGTRAVGETAVRYFAARAEQGERPVG
jgi:uncharacterized protein (DUF697 family)